jgi:phytoene dehydrogenase-like protein
MARYDVVIIGAGLGGLTAGAILSRAGRKVLVLERGNSVGGAASSYKAGDLFIEASLHKTSAPQDARDPKHGALTRAGVLDKVEWVPTGALHEVRGGPLDAPFSLPDGFAAARAALDARFPDARAGIASVLGDMERIAGAMGTLAQRRNGACNPATALGDVRTMLPDIADWDISLAARLDRAFGANEAVKCALAGNLWHYHDDPASLWWVYFAASQGQFIQSGGRYVRTGSQRLSSALARAIKGAGGDVLLRRIATGVGVDATGRVSAVLHEAKAGGDPQTAEGACIVSNAAPATLAAMLPDAHAARLRDAYRDLRPSISLFALTLGLSRPPADIGLTAYSTQLLPDWMTTLADYPKGAMLFGGEPDGRVPPMSLVSYAAIDSGVPSPPFIVSAVGADRLGNWAGMEREAYTARRARWQAAILSHLDTLYPGFAAAVAASSFNTASSMVSYLNAPDGAAYGFAPTPPGPDGAVARTPRTVLDGLYLASAYAGFGGYSGAIEAGLACADAVLAEAA